MEFSHGQASRVSRKGQNRAAHLLQGNVGGPLHVATQHRRGLHHRRMGHSLFDQPPARPLILRVEEVSGARGLIILSGDD